MPYDLIKENHFKHNLESMQKKLGFKQLNMFWLKAKQEKQRETNIVRFFMKWYALSVNFILFYDFDLKSENVMLFHNLCQVTHSQTFWFILIKVIIITVTTNQLD